MADSREDRDTDPAPPSRRDPFHEVRALVIDDDPLSVDLLSYQMPESVRKYLRLTHVKSLSEALHLIESGERVDVVLLDLGLPGFSGRRTLKEFQKHAPTIPVVVLTGNDDAELKRQLVDDGAFGYLLKGQIPPREIANLIVRVAVSSSPDPYIPGEPEVFRRSTAANVRLRSALTKPPEAPGAREEVERASAEALVAQAGEANMANTKLDLLLSHVVSMKTEQARTGVLLDETVKRVDKNTVDIDGLKKVDQEFKLERVTDKAEMKVKVAEARIDAALDTTHAKVAVSKERWAVIGSIGVALVGTISALIAKGCS